MNSVFPANEPAPSPVQSFSDQLPAPVQTIVSVPLPKKKFPLKKLFMLPSLVFAISIVIFFAPLPYYQPASVVCKMGQECPKPGWHLGLSVWQILLPTKKDSMEIVNTSQTTSTPTPTQEVLVPMETLSAKVSTTGWKSHEDSYLGFKFLYPDNFTISNNSVAHYVNKTDNDQNYLIIFVQNLSYPNNDLDTLAQRFHENTDFSAREEGTTFKSTQKVLVNGIPGILLKDIEVSNDTNDLLMIPHANLLYSVFVYNRSQITEDKELVDTILSTFNITKQEPIQKLSGYINKSGNFGFNRPSSWVFYDHDKHLTIGFEDGKIEASTSNEPVGTTLESIAANIEESYFKKDEIQSSYETINNMRFLVLTFAHQAGNIDMQSYTILDNNIKYSLSIYFFDNLVKPELHQQLHSQFIDLIHSFRILKNQ